MRLARKFWYIFDHFLYGLASLSGTILFCLMLLIIYEVVMRYVFRNPPGWAIEVSEYTMLWIVFLGTGWLLKERGHVQVDMLYLRLNSRKQVLLDIIVSLLGSILFLIVFWATTTSLVDFAQRNLIDVGTLKIPKAITFAVIPLGCLALAVEFIKQAISYIRLRKSTEKVSVKEVHQS